MNLRLGWNSKKALRRNVGVTLLEVLVSLLILSFGLLGVAGLQAVTASYKVNSWARNSAALLLSDFAERVRANSHAADLYGFKETWPSQASKPSKDKKEDCLESTCTYQERAAYDLVAWRERVRDEMPQGSVWVDGPVDDRFDVTLMWMDKGFTKPDAKENLLQSPSICENGQTKVEEASCCPRGAEVVQGVRCQRFFFIP